MSRRKIQRQARRRLKTASGAAVGAALLATSPAGAADFTVSSNADNGAGSLRAAITAANAAVGPDRIVFAPSVVSPISVTSASLPIVSESLDIVGPGADNLTITAASGLDLFHFTTATGRPASISGLRLSGVEATPLRVAGGGRKTVSEMVVAGNSGPGIIIQGDGFSRVEDSTITGNSGTGLSAPLVVSSSVARVERTTVTANSGTAAVILLQAAVRIENSTISGNTGPAIGGVLSYFANGTEIESTTIAGNTGGSYGGGLASLVDSVPVTVHNSVIAGNTAPTNPDANVVSPPGFSTPPIEASFTLFGSEPGASVTTTVPSSNIFGANPGLGILASNGGLTQTHAIGPDSPAIDAGDPNDFPATDQRGVPRPQGSAPDLGSFELEDTAAPAVKVKKPKKKLKIAGKKATISLSFKADETATFECALKGGKPKLAKFAPCTSPVAYKLKGKPGKGAEYKFSVRGTDPNGNVSKAAKASFRVIAKR